MSTMYPTRPTNSRPSPGEHRSGGSSLPTPSIDPFKVMRKHLTALISACVFGVVFGIGVWIALMFLYPLFTSRVQFEIKAGLEEAGQVVESDLEKDDVVIRRARTEMAYMVSRDVLREAMQSPDVQAKTDWANWFRDSGGNFMIEDAVDELEEDLVVRYVPDTNLFEVEWSAHNKRDVPLVLMEIADSYLQNRRAMEERQFSEDLSLFQSDEDNLNRELQNLQAEISDFVEKYTIFTLEDIEKHPLSIEVVNLNNAIAEAQSNLSMLRSQYEQTALKLGGELEPTAEDRMLAEQDRTVLALIARIVDLKAEQRRLIDKVGPGHESVKEIERRVRAAEEQRDERVEEIMERNLTGQLKNTQNMIETYSSMIEEYQSDLQDKNQQLTDLAGKVSEYESLTQRREQIMTQLQATRELLTELQRVRLRSAAERVRLFTAAQTPRERSFPLPEIIIPLGFLLVVGATMGVIFLRELTDKRVKSASDLAVVPGAKVLGVIPELQEDPTRISKAETAVRDEPRSVIAESYRQTSTPILKSMEKSGHQSLVVVGGLPGAGSTTVVSNLAAFMAAGGKRVLAIDANFRRPGLAAALGCAEPDRTGLGDLLTGDASVDSAIAECSTGIDIMTAGSAANRVFERLNNGQFEQLIAELRGRYDYILVDAPPAVVAGDAQVLANKTDASLLVVRANQEHRGLVARLVNQFNDAQSELLGIVLNRPRWTAGGYFKKNFATMAEYTSKSGAAS